MTVHSPTTQVWLACRRPTTCIWRVERSSRTSPRSIQHRERWYATIVGFLCKEGFKWWNNLPISKQEENKKNPKEVFKAIADTLEVFTSYWNHINEMYSDIRQGEHGSTDQAWPTYQGYSQEMPVPELRKWYVGQSCFFMQWNILKSRSGSDCRRGERMSHIKPSSSMPRSMKWQWKTSTDTNQKVEL